MPTNIEINDQIAKRPFGNIEDITSIHFGKDVNSIYEDAFKDFPNLETVTFDPECKITTIKNGAFAHAKKLTYIRIPDSVETIENRAFFSCTNLNKIDLPKNLTAIGANAFARCTNLESIKIPNSVQTIEAATFLYCNSLKSISLPKNLTTILFSAFESCTNLTTITIPDSVKTIARSAFSHCNNLRTMNIGKNVSRISQNAFSQCPNLTEINLPTAKINDLDFANPNQLTQEQLNKFKTDLKLPEYCNIKVSGQIIEPDSNAKIEQCKAILEDNRYTYEIKAVIRSQLAFSYKKIGNHKNALEEINKIKESGYLKNNDLPNCSEWKKQCLSNCNSHPNSELVTLENQLARMHKKEKYLKTGLPILKNASKKDEGPKM